MMTAPSSTGSPLRMCAYRCCCPNSQEGFPIPSLTTDLGRKGDYLSSLHKDEFWLLHSYCTGHHTVEALNLTVVPSTRSMDGTIKWQPAHVDGAEAGGSKLNLG